jgi:GH24 family phage-related lysozyme (muramidase)
MCDECRSGNLQRKLAIGASNDPLEQEADRVADQVLATPAHPVVDRAPPRIQRFAGQPTGQADTAPASVHRTLASAGKPLELTLRHDMEQRFGYDFGRVRVHSGAAAEQSALDVNANAYTVGHDVVFGSGRFAPETHQGRRLIAHELTHVVQQSGSDEIRIRQGNEQRGLSPVSLTCPRFHCPVSPLTTLSNGRWLTRQASDEPEFDEFDFIGKVRYYVNALNVEIALPLVFRILNGLSMTDMLNILTALNDAQRKKLDDNWGYAVGVNVPRIEVALMAVMARRRTRNFDCCLLANFARDNPGQKNIITKYLSESVAIPSPTSTTHEISDEGTELIASEEGFIDHLYNDPVGHCTIGFGHLVHKGNCNAGDRETWGERITRDDALKLLRRDVQRRVADVNRLVRVQITQSQFDALVSFHFNTGALSGSSALRELNQCNHEKVPEKLAQFNKARNQAGELVELTGLTARRAREGRLFLSVSVCQ